MLATRMMAATTQAPDSAMSTAPPTIVASWVSKSSRVESIGYMFAGT